MDMIQALWMLFTVYGFVCGKFLTSKEKLWHRLLMNYSKGDAPTRAYSTEVKIGIYVNSFFSISEASMDYSISFYLRQAWNDPRLTFDPIDGTVTEVKLPDGSWDKIWVPDVFFRNEKEADYHSLTTDNRLLRLSSNGDLWYVAKITARLSCPMMLKRYPLDTQACPMMFESFGYTSDTMFFTWMDPPAQVDQGNRIPQFTLRDIVLSDCSQNYTGGSFTCLQLDFILARDTGFFILQVYIPSMMVVILSWVSFYINVEAIPARVSVGLITVLTMTTASTSANSSLPRVSYVKAIDVWMSMCLLFVFAALLEYSIVNIISRSGQPKAQDARTQNRKGKNKTHSAHIQNRHGHKNAPTSDHWNIRKAHMRNIEDHNRKHNVHMHTMCHCQGEWSDSGHSSGPLNVQAETKISSQKKERKFSIFTVKKPLPDKVDPLAQARKKAVTVDKVSRCLFPLGFFIFNVVYWVVYTTKNGLVDN